MYKFNIELDEYELDLLNQMMASFSGNNCSFISKVLISISKLKQEDDIKDKKKILKHLYKKQDAIEELIRKISNAIKEEYK